MKCPECLFANPPDTGRCEACGYGFLSRDIRQVSNTGLPGKFLSFRAFIAPPLIQWGYLCGALILTAFCAFAVFAPDFFADRVAESSHVIAGAVLLCLAGNLLWRLICEAAILLFNIHGLLVRIEERANSPAKDPLHEWV